MYLYKVSQTPKWPMVYDKSGLLMPVPLNGCIVNDNYRDSVDKFLRTKGMVYFLDLKILKTMDRMKLEPAQINDKLQYFNPKYKNLFIESISKCMNVIRVDEYKSNFYKCYQNLTAVVFPSKPNLLCISFVSQKKQVKAVKFIENIVYINAPIVDKNIKEGFMTIDFTNITSVLKTNGLTKALISFLCANHETRDQILMHSKKIPQCSNKKVRFSSRIYYNNDIPRFKITNKSILKPSRYR